MSDLDRNYNPTSVDAMFSRILERLDAQDRRLDEILAQTTKTNSRVDALERQHWYHRGIAAMVSLLVVALWNWFSK